MTFHKVGTIGPVGGNNAYWGVYLSDDLFTLTLQDLKDLWSAAEAYGVQEYKNQGGYDSMDMETYLQMNCNVSKQNKGI